jgi:hypothetical protein
MTKLNFASRIFAKAVQKTQEEGSPASLIFVPFEKSGAHHSDASTQTKELQFLNVRQDPSTASSKSTFGGFVFFIEIA